jgi:hypothetical protein
MVNVASSADIKWEGPGTDWNVGTNWVGDSVPGPDDTAIIDGTATGPGPTIASDVDVNNIYGPHGDGQVINVTGGHIVVNDAWSAEGLGDDDASTINISGSPIIEIYGVAPRGYGRGWAGPEDGKLTINISGDPNIHIVTSGIRGADEIDSVFDFYMSGGDVNCGIYMIGDNGSGDFYLTGGRFVCRGEFKIHGREGGFTDMLVGGEGSPAELIIGGSFLTPDDEDGSALIDLDNGYIECGEWNAAGENWILDINEGLLRIKNPSDTNFAEIQSWIDANQITGYDNTVTPIVTKDGDDYVVTVYFVHYLAYDESPVDFTTGMCPTDVNLSWTPGEYVDDHNIYFGDEPCDVSDSATALVEGYGPNSWSPPGPLELGKMYYWRVDTVNEPNVWTGGIWQFQIENGQARGPNPTNGIRGIPYADVESLSWTPSCVAANHIVWFGEGLPGSIVLFEDDFEDGFDANWAVTTGWSIYDATDDPNKFGDHNNNLASAVAGTLRSGDIDTSDANSINVSFAILLDKGVGSGEVTLNYYNGSTYVPVADWNENDPCDTWLGYGDTITDSQYLDISNFRIQLVSTLAGPNSVYINNVSVSNTWPIAAEYYQGETSDSNWPVSVDAWKAYSWRIDTIITGGKKVQGPHWTFQTGLGGLLMYYKFDGSIGAHLADPIYDDSGNNVRFDKYTSDGGSAVYGESNPVLVSSSAGAVFDPNAGLHRLDPCAPDEIDPLRLSGYQHTVELWVKPTRLHSDMDIDDDDWADEDDDICLIGKHDSWGIYISDPGNDNQYRFKQSNNGEGLEEDTAKEDEWAHLALVYDQTAEDSYQMYLNGLLVDSQDEGMNSNDNNYPVTIGYARRDDVNLGRFFEGVIDEVRIHDVALAFCELLISPGPQWPSCPSPEDGQQEVDACSVLVLSWTAGSEADSRKVYFSTDFVEVDTLDAAALIYEGPNTTVSRDVGVLEEGTIYHWRVVELNGGGPWEGEIWNFATTFPVDDPSLRVWYEFDEKWGDTAYDHSGHGFHAEGADNDWDANGGKWGGCLVFDDDKCLEPSSNIFSTLTSGITVAVWLNGERNPDQPQPVFDTGTEDREFKLQASVPDDDGDVVWRAGNDSNDLMIWPDARPSAWAGDWHHLAFVKDENAGTMSIYFDGLLAITQPGAIASLATNIYQTRPFRIGAYGGEDDDDYEGSMDDFRIYDRVLTDANIAELFRGGDLDVAWGPDPYDGQPDASPDANLTWLPGDHAADHNVFFGTTRSEVEAMVDPCATLGLGDELYDPCTLELNTYYFWRIDEVNGPSTWTGPVWRFKVRDFVILDDFEQYKASSPKIIDIWYSGPFYSSGHPQRSGSKLELARLSLRHPVHGGKQAMKYTYQTDSSQDWYQTLDYADACLPLAEIEGFTDWNSVDVRLLTMTPPENTPRCDTATTTART